MHPLVKAYVSAFNFIFFPLRRIFLENPQFKGDKWYTKIMQESIGHRSSSRAKENFFPLSGPLIEKKYGVLGMRARLFA